MDFADSPDVDRIIAENAIDRPILARRAPPKRRWSRISRAGSTLRDTLNKSAGCGIVTCHM